MTTCKDCKGLGYKIEFDEIRKDVAVPCKCWLEKEESNALHKRLRAAGIPKSYLGYTLETYKKLTFANMNTKSLDILKNYMEKPDEFLENYNVLWLWGREPVACHTTLAVIFASELIKHGYKVKFLLMQQFLDMFTSFEEKKEYFSSLKNFDVFLLDNALAPETNFAKDYTLLHFYNWFLGMLTDGKHFICTAKNTIGNINKEYKRCKFLLVKCARSLKFDGSLYAELIDAVDNPEEDK